MVPCGKRPPKEVQPPLDHGGKRNDKPGHRSARVLGKITAVFEHIAVVQHVAHHPLLKYLLPELVVVRGGLVEPNPEKLLSQGEECPVAVRIVESKPALHYGPVISQGGEHPRESGVTQLCAHRVLPGKLADAPVGDDRAHKVLS